MAMVMDYERQQQAARESVYFAVTSECRSVGVSESAAGPVVCVGKLGPLV